MNCLTEALGLSLPGNGTVVATHADRKQLFLRAGRLAVELCKRYYEQDDASVLPRAIATKAAFENAMTLDVAMGGLAAQDTVASVIAGATSPEQIAQNVAAGNWSPSAADRVALRTILT